MINLMSNEHRFMPITMTSHSTISSPTSRDNMGLIDFPLNYDISRLYMNFQSPPVSATILLQGQMTPPMSDLGGLTEDDFRFDYTFYTPPVSATMSSQEQLTPPMSISDGYTEHDFTTFDCTLPAEMALSNENQEKRRMQNREAQRRFRARNQKHIKALQKELNDLRVENTKLLEEHKKKDEENSRLQKKIKDMNREAKDTRKKSKETDEKMDCEMPVGGQRFRPTDLVRTESSALLVHSEHTYESFCKKLEATAAGDESEEMPETTGSEPEKYFLLLPLTVC